MKSTLTVLVVALALASAAPAQKKGSDIVDTAIAAGDFQTLATALTHAGLVKTLKGKGPFTVFAPTDAAFAKLPDGVVASLLEPANKDKLTGILTYHVVPAAVPAAEAVKLAAAPTANGQRARIAVSDDGVTIDGARIVKTDIHCSNGIIHVIDAVMLPESKNIVETAAAAEVFDTLLAAAKAAGLAKTLAEGGPFTVLAPTDAAFARLPEGTVADLLRPENRQKLTDILELHLISGRVYADQVLAKKEVKTLQGETLAVHVGKNGVRIGDARVAETDVEAANGVIHVIDAVLLPAEKTSKSSRRTGGSCGGAVTR